MTLGPRGRNVVIDKKWGAPTITNDGVTIAKEIELEDSYENLGAQLAKEVATKTNDVAGDGTTTATVLAQAMVKEGLRNVAAGAAPVGAQARHRRGRRRPSTTGCSRWPARSTARTRSPTWRPSPPRTPTIGELIAEAFDKVGKDGVITVEESSTTAMELDFTEGMQFDKGYISPYFVTDPERMEAVLEDAYVLVHQNKISAISRAAAAAGEGAAGRQAAVHRRRGRRRRGALDARRQQDPRHVHRRRRQGAGLRRPPQGDAAGPRRSSPAARSSRPEVGLKLDQVGLEVLGTARRVVVTKDDTTVVEGGRLAEAEVDGRVAQIKAEIERTDSDWDREKLQERLAKLAGGVCVIKVGAHTEVELKEKKHRIEDAVSATRAAIEEGIVAGGGSALVHAVSVLDGNLGLTGDEATGVAIVRKAAAEPLRWIAENAGLEGYVVVEKVRALPVGQGLDAAEGDYVDLHGPRRHRPGQGDPVGAAQRRLDRVDGAHHRHPGGGEEGARAEDDGAVTATATATATDRAAAPRAHDERPALAARQGGAGLSSFARVPASGQHRDGHRGARRSVE